MRRHILKSGYRFYDPQLGRWINRDPIGEKGGLNLYSFVRNEPISSWDLLGAEGFSYWAKLKMNDLLNNHDHEVGSVLKTQYPQKFKDLHSTDCITFVGNVLSYAFEKVGDLASAKEVWKNSKKGTNLAQLLIGKGWKAIYWNPDVKNPRDYNPANPNGAWTEHPFSYHIAKTQSTYYGIPITESVINYNPTFSANKRFEETTPMSLSGYNKLNDVQFAVGLARGGKHTFLFSKNKVYEVHWDKIADELYEKSNFRDFEWLSGAMVIPPDGGF